MDCGHAPRSPKQDMVAQIDKALNTKSLDLMASVIIHYHQRQTEDSESSVFLPAQLL